MHSKFKNFAFWLSTPNPMMVEAAHDKGLTRLVLDLEHGAFDQSQLNMFIPFCKALGFEICAKVLAPEAMAIQQALDFGADAVIIPHVEGVDHAREVTAHAKYPPLGNRSYAAGRIVRYDALPAGFFQNENNRVKCYPMVESSAALTDVEAILALPTVDGLFVGPSDLALSRGRSTYCFDGDDRTDIKRIAVAAEKFKKPWIMPAWTQAERQFSLENNAAWLVALNEFGVAMAGLGAGLTQIENNHL
ncbi:HpcH/HpaI aldolase family protein [Kordiimonas pumila]|uniref:HpcH/HpaI aldolase/citrate lyase family protein n=1 Tax=Kordiimonas pumila TaxID=2161677 RepID=A0ABV7D3W6_9PROT|nr:aldolase/citrate lyase family protein [Kordiimonas pumila]